MKRIDLSRDPAAMGRLKEEAEKAKKELSSALSAQLNLPFIAVGKDGPHHLDLTLSRPQFEMMTGDLLARIGGEEFLIVLPGLSQTQALGAASRLCSRINGEPFVVPGQLRPVPVTTSIGLVTVAPAAGAAQLSAGELIAHADRALYRAKDTGRNRVSLADAAAA